MSTLDPPLQPAGCPLQSPDRVSWSEASHWSQVSQGRPCTPGTLSTEMTVHARIPLRGREESVHPDSRDSVLIPGGWKRAQDQWAGDWEMQRECSSVLRKESLPEAQHGRPSRAVRQEGGAGAQSSLIPGTRSLPEYRARQC